MSDALKFAVDLQVTERGKKSPQYTIETDHDGAISLAELFQFMKEVLIITADDVLKEEQRMGFDPKPLIAVDGRIGKPVENVKPFGSIEITSKANIKEIILETFEGLWKRSKVLTGDYIQSHRVLLNGTQVAHDMASLRLWLSTDPKFKDSDLIRFVNIQPYARKLERYGITAQRSKVRDSKRKDKRSGQVRIRPRQPNGAYFLTARAIRAKYKRNSIIRFSFISGSGIVGVSGTFKSRKGKPGRSYLYPTIIISVQEGGLA